MLTGLVFFYNFYRKKLSGSLFKDYYKKRVLYIIVPYLFWAVFYEFYAHYTIGRELEISAIVSRILQRESYYRLHFIFIIAQFYLIFPLFIMLAKKSVLFRKYMWLAGIILEVVYQYINNRYSLTNLSLFLSLAGPYPLGGWIGIYYEKQKEKVKRVVSTSLFGIVFLIAGATVSLLHYHLYFQETFFLDGFYYSIVNINFLMAESYFFFRIAEILEKRSREKLKKTVENIVVYSFGFYLLTHLS